MLVMRPERHWLCSKSSMRHTDIPTTMNVYGDMVTDKMAQAHSTVAGLALKGSRA
jgi:hypothetical protein